MATNPVEVIARARKRIARIAALTAASYFAAPVITALVLAALLPAIGTLTWERLGYMLAPDAMDATRMGLLAVAAVILGAGAFRAWRAYLASNDFVGAAERIDRKIKAHEQVVTLATLTDPEAPDTARVRRSALFPLLWRNVMAALGAFDPRKEFGLEIGQPLARSSLFAAAIALALGLAMLALVEPPTALRKTALRLKELANKIEETSASPEDRALAESVKKAANDLLNPKLPPEEKRKQLETVLREVEKREAAGAKQSQSSAGAGTGTSSAQNASGQGQGAGQGGGESKGESKGGKGAGQGGKKSEQKKGKTDTIELHNELAKAEAQIQTEELTPDQSGAKPSPEEKTGNAPQPGEKPNEKGGSQKQANQKGTAPMPIPKPEANARNQMPNNAGGKNTPQGGGQGDTHLGEFPAPANYQRFLKPGEKGEALNIKDARYVMFRIPSATPSGGGGKTVIDTERPKATTAYTNAPLAPTADNAPPDERQLVPPRYRDLIR